jgi:outer membrane PBP1 activator LpoA protein
MKKTNLIIMLLFTILTLTGCNTVGSTPSATTYSANTNETATLKDPGLWKKSNNLTWQTLQHTPLHTLESEQAAAQEPVEKGWLSLAVLSKKYSTNTPQLVKELQAWRENYPTHPANSLIPSDATLQQLLSEPAPQHLALLLPLHGSMAASGQIVRSGFLSAYYNNAGERPEKQTISFYDTNENPDIAALYQKALNEGADLVIGPLTKAEVEALTSYNHFEVRIIALNYTQASFFKSLPTNFYEFGLSPVEEAKQVALKARQAGHSNALIIAADDAWGHRVASACSSQWQSAGGQVTDSLYFTSRSNLTQDIATLLQINTQEDARLARKDNSKTVLAEQRRHDFDVIFIFAQPDMGRQIVPLLRFYYAGNVPLYSISAIYSGRPNPGKDRDLNGVTFSEIPWIIQVAHSGTSSPGQYDRLYAIGRDAYLLSQALPRLDALPNFPIYGATGALDMDQQQIHQRLPWVTMRDGQI